MAADQMATRAKELEVEVGRMRGGAAAHAIEMATGVDEVGVGVG